MRRVALHLSVAALTAGLFTWIRGGFRDEPIVLLVFGLAGLAASVSIAHSVKSIQRIDGLFGISPAAARWRSVAAALWALGTLAWAGRAITAAGFGGWFIALLILFFTPMVAALIAVWWPIGFGVLTVTCVVASVVLETLGSRWGGYAQVAGNWPVYVVTWLIGVALSCVSSVPLHMRRGRPTRG
jgi:hypothetical protein